jgi:hypothetical protein
MKNKKDSSKNAEATVVWKTTVKPKTKGNIVEFPTHFESTYQEVPIHQGQVRLKIVSSGFGRSKNFSSTHMQLAA